MAYPRFAWGLTIVAGVNDEIDFDINGVNDVITIDPGPYRWLGDGSGDDMALALKTALEKHSQGGTFTVTIDDDGLVNILYSAAVVVAIYWQSGSATPGWFGRKSALESFVGNVGSTGPYLAGGTWYPGLPCIDDRVIPYRLGSHAEPITPNGETTETGEWETVAFRWDWVWGLRVLQDSADQATYATVYHPSGASGAGDPNIAFETMWDHLWKNNETYEEDGVYYYPAGGSTPEEGPYYMWGSRQALADHLRVTNEGGPAYSVSIWVKK
jgi:hypothetical protein